MAAVTEPTDQQNVQQCMIINGQTALMNATTLKASAGGSNVYKFTQTWTAHRSGHTVVYKHGCIYALTATEKAELLAASAPMVQQ